MTHRSLFKEVAQRIVQSAQSSENHSSRESLCALRPATAAPHSQPPQMSGSTFDTTGLTSPTDTSVVPHR